MNQIAAIALLILTAGLSLSQNPAASQAEQIVTLRAIRVKGTRLSEKSIAHLTGLQPGQKMDEGRLRSALKSANDSGLFKNIAYNYESEAGSTDVILELNIEDQLPLVPAIIKITRIDPEAVWRYLEAFDSLFTRELPSSNGAVDLYARYMTKYLQSLGQADVVVRGNAMGTTQTTGIEFVAVKLRAAGR